MESGQLFELRRTTLDTPHFRGIEFIEAEAKSIINHVPGTYLPFNYTINPYRGCTHSCSYCTSGDTPILMADGRTTPIAEIEVGDRIYGTVFDGKYRRYVTTDVLAHWSTVKPAYRVRLEDGTEVVCSGDHRFLSDRGWKHVTGTEHGTARRPHLTTNNKLMGTGKFEAAPEHTPEYRRGYVCGMIRGDGHVGSYSYQRPGRTHGDVYRFRLALVDFEALRRTRSYLRQIGIARDEFLFQEATAGTKRIDALRTSARASVAALQDAVHWPDSPSDDWCKGFLAGIFDAEGSYSRGILRIANTDQELVDRITSSLRRFGFAFAVETRDQAKPITCIGVVGGVRQHLRFFHLVDPAVTRKRTIEGQAIKNNAPLRVVSIEPLAIDLPMYDITTGTGDFIANGVVSHNCFARVTHTYMDMNAGKDFETKIVVKVNAPQLLRKELRAKKWKGEHIAMGTATDPYQRAEGRYKLMPPIIETLTEFRNPFSILTKGTLILRDLDLLAEAARHMHVTTALSIGTLDEDAWRKSEPGTPHPRKRIEAVAKLNQAGVACGVMVAPILPGITDTSQQLREVVTAAIDAGATHVSPILLHLRPGVKEVYMMWLEETYPDLVPRYREMYPKAYAPSPDRNAVGRQVAALVQEAGGLKPRPEVASVPSLRFIRRSQNLKEKDSDEQLRLL